MVTLTSFRSKLQTKVFDKIGSTALHSSYTSGTFNSWGDRTATHGTATSITVVPYNYIATRFDYRPFGDLREGECIVITPWTVAVAADDLITYDSVNYRVQEIEKFMFDDGVVARAIRLAKVM